MNSSKYLNDMRLLYQSGSPEDEDALNNELTQGFQANQDMQNFMDEKSSPGWKTQIKKEDAQIWDLVFHWQDYAYEEE